HGLVAFYATVGLALFLLRDIRQLGDEAERHLRGGEMEEAVATQLDPLRAADGSSSTTSSATTAAGTSTTSPPRPAAPHSRSRRRAADSAPPIAAKRSATPSGSRTSSAPA